MIMRRRLKGYAKQDLRERHNKADTLVKWEDETSEGEARWEESDGAKQGERMRQKA